VLPKKIELAGESWGEMRRRAVIDDKADTGQRLPCWRRARETQQVALILLKFAELW
jgi:hypothetical protein